MTRPAPSIVVFVATDSDAVRPLVEGRGGTVQVAADGTFVAAFRSLGVALDTAIEIQEATAGTARVAVHVGEPRRSGDRWAGPAVDTVLRLVDDTAAGTIASTKLVGLLAAPMVRFGFDAPADAAWLELAWATPDDEPLGREIPIPQGLNTTGLPFHGRTAAVAALRDAWARTAGPGWRLALVAGEPGVGKTRLASEFAHEVAAQGAIVLHGRCDEVPLGPYQPFVEALRHYAAHTSPREQAVLREQAPVLARLIPELGGPEPLAQGRIDDGLARYSLFEAMGSIVDHASTAAPVLLVLDDLHWADQATIVLLRHLLTRRAAGRVLVLGTYRDTRFDERSVLADALADLRRTGDVDRIGLRGLGRDAVVAICRERAGHELDADLHAMVERLAVRTEGNPLFLTHMLRHLSDTGTLLLEDGRWELSGSAGTIGLPDGVHSLIAERLARLSPRAEEVLTAAAVLGSQFPVTVLEATSGVSGDELLDLVDEALGARIVEEGGGADSLGFAHAMIREVLHDRLSASRRQRLHRRAAEAWQNAGGEPAEVAHHLLAAVPTIPATEAAAGVVLAARAAIESTGYEAAIELCTTAVTALALPTGDERRVELLAVRAQAQMALGALDDARAGTVDAAGVALDAGHLYLAVEALVRWCGFAPEVGADERDVVALTDRALAAAPPPVLRARLLGARTWRRLADPDHDGVERECVEAYELARTTGDAEALLHATIAYRVVSDRRPLVERRPDILAATEEATAHYGERVARAIGRRHAMVLACERADRDAFERARADFEAESKAAAWPMGMAVALRTRASDALRAGRFAEADGLAAEARVLAPFALRSQQLHDFAVAAEQGRAAALIPAITALIEQQPEIGAWMSGLALALVQAGRPDAAADTLRPLVDRPRLLDHPGVAATTLAVAPLAAAAIGDPVICERLYEHLVRWCGQNLVVLDFLCWGSADRRAGLLAGALGRTDAAVAHFEAGIDVDERFGSTLWAANGRAALAEL